MSRMAQIGLALIVALFFSLRSNAAGLEDRQGWVGGLAGITVPNYTNSTSRLMYGVTAGAKLGTELGLGAYFLTSSKNESGSDFNYDLYGIEATYHFEGEAAGAFFGARVGISKVRTGIGQTSPTNYGVVAGYDYPLSDRISLGGEASYMRVASGDISGGSGNGQTIDAFGMINFLGALKFWF